MEALREEDAVRLEEAVLRKLEEKLAPLLEQIASNVTKTAMHELRLDLMTHISRHETTIRRLSQSEAARSELARVR